MRSENLKTLYNNAIKDDESYYYENCSKFCYSYFNNKSRCKSFISKYINAANKSDTILSKNLIKINKREKFRLAHTISTYFLGSILIQNCNVFRKRVFNEEIIKEPNNDEEFYFIWFLISLFHDLGYPYENGNNLELDDLFKSPYIDKTQSKEGIPNFYNDQLAEDYCIHRKTNDHGIASGLMLYFDLCEIQKKKEKEISGLNWENDRLMRKYKYASSIIFAHNIWFAKNTVDIENYKIAKLDDLILIDNQYKIEFKKHPIFFLFCLIDTIEPIKVLKDMSIIDDIKISLKSEGDRKIEIEINCENIRNDVLKKEYLDKIKSLENWLTPVKICQNTALITINCT